MIQQLEADSFLVSNCGAGSNVLMSKSLHAEWLKSLRSKLKLSQKDVANVLNVTGTVVSNIEIGQRELKETEIQTLEKQYGIRFSGEGESPKPGSYREEAFFVLQQNFLNKARGPYELWFLNPAALPMLHSERAKDTWVDNLASGQDYKTLWLFDHPNTRQDFAAFYSSALEVANRVVPRKDKEPGRIHIYPFHFPDAASTDKDVIESYDDLIKERKTLSSDQEKQNEYQLIQLAERVQLDGDPKVRQIFIDFYIRCASLVVYIPTNRIKDDSLVAVEFRQLGIYVILEPDESKAAVREFEMAKSAVEKRRMTSLVDKTEQRKRKRGK